MVGLGLGSCKGSDCYCVKKWNPPRLPTCSETPLFCSGLNLATSTFSLFFKSELSATVCYNCSACPYSGLGQQFELILNPHADFTNTYLQCDIAAWDDINSWMLYGANSSDDCFYGAWSGFASLETECTRNNVFGCENPPWPNNSNAASFVWAVVYVWRSGYSKVVILRGCYQAGGTVKVDPGDPQLVTGEGGVSMSVSTYAQNLNCCGNTTLSAGPYSGNCSDGLALPCCNITMANSTLTMNC